MTAKQEDASISSKRCPIIEKVRVLLFLYNFQCLHKLTNCHIEMY